MGLIDLARQGRNGDTTVAHLTPGELVVPREVAAMRPDLVAHIRGSIAGYGADPSRYVVGSRRARRNPATGAQEFATDDEIRQAYQAQLGRDADDAGLDYWRDPAHGFSLDAGGSFMAGVGVENAAKAANAPAPAFAPPPAPSPAPAPSAYAGDYGAPPPPPASALAAGTPPGAAASPGQAPAPSAASAAAGHVVPNSKYDVQSWYRNDLGRDGEQAGLDYWNTQLGNGSDPDKVYAAFQAGAVANGEAPKALGLAAANAAYGGYTSDVGNSTVDEWFTNNLGRNASAADLARYGGFTTPAEAQAAYARFQADTGGGKGLGLVAASRLQAPAPNAPLNLTYQPDLDRSVSPDATIEGRLNNVLRQDASGNYTNGVVRQAVERAQQQFATRGLLNSSMAAQAGQEAAIAKAIDIVGPDAQRFFEQARANQDAQNSFAAGEVNQIYTQQNAAQAQQYAQANNQAQWAHDDAGVDRQQSFNLQQNYIVATDKVNQRYGDRVNNINVSNMTPEDKSIAIQQAAEARDGELVYTNTLFSAQPTWQNQWAAVAVGTGTLNIAVVRNKTTLYNIVNDPAQPQPVRDSANRRLQQIAAEEATAAATALPPPAAPAPAPAESG